jgi:hypothetical protein
MKPLAVMFALTCSIGAYAQPATLDGPFQIRYASNLTQGDSVVNITNTGANGNNLYGPGFGGPAGNICVNVYAFSPDEQLISCCSCLVTPNGLVSLSANNDLTSNTLTGVRPDSIVIKLVATATGTERHHHAGAADTDDPSYSGTSCINSAALAGQKSFPLTDAGLLAWGTTIHAAVAPTGAYSITETPFLPGTLNLVDPSRDPTTTDELTSMTNRCVNIIGNGSTFGVCRSCRLGGLGGSKL